MHRLRNTAYTVYTRNLTIYLEGFWILNFNSKKSSSMATLTSYWPLGAKSKVWLRLERNIKTNFFWSRKEKPRFFRIGVLAQHDEYAPRKKIVSFGSNFSAGSKKKRLFSVYFRLEEKITWYWGLWRAHMICILSFSRCGGSLIARQTSGA